MTQQTFLLVLITDLRIEASLETPVTALDCINLIWKWRAKLIAHEMLSRKALFMSCFSHKHFLPQNKACNHDYDQIEM